MISVIIPVHNEKENIRPLLTEIVEASQNAPISEVIYIDDASTDSTFEELNSVRLDFPMLRIIKHSVCSGQSAALMTGVRAAGNTLIVLMDGDGQNDPKDISKLYNTYLEQNKKHKKVMITGQRLKRKDNTLRRFSSKYANAIRSWMLKDGTKDTGCSLKLIRREDYLRLPYFNHMHRFLPALLIRDNVEIIQVEVTHRPRRAGISKYGFWNRFWVGIIDLLGVKWLMSRGVSENLQTEEILDSKGRVISYERRNDMA